MAVLNQFSISKQEDIFCNFSTFYVVDSNEGMT